MSRPQFPINELPTFIKELLDLYKGKSETPQEFIVGSGFFVGSLFAGPWVTLDGERLNNYYLLVGPTSSRKTTAQKISEELVASVLGAIESVKPKKVKFSEEIKDLKSKRTRPISVVSNFSVEGLSKHELGYGTSTGVSIPEYKTVFGISKRQGQSNTISELTSFYDGQRSKTVLVSRQSEITGYCFSLLACSTPEWLKDFLGESNIGGGYVNRHLVFGGESTVDIPFPEKLFFEKNSPFVKWLEGLLPSDLSYVIKDNEVFWEGSTKELTWDKEATNLFNAAYSFERKKIRECSNVLIADIAARELTHVKKIAGLCCFLEGRTKVSKKDIILGFLLARWCTRNAAELCLKNISVVKAVPKADKVINFIEANAPVNKTDIARYFGGSQDTVNKALAMLKTQEVILEIDGKFELNKIMLSNSQLQDIDKYLGESSIYEIQRKLELETNVSQEVL